MGGNSISEIEPGLFIGNAEDSRDPKVLLDNHITSMVSLLPEPLDIWERSAFMDIISPDRHLWIACSDSSTQDLLVYMSRVCDFIYQMLSDSGKSVDEWIYDSARASGNPTSNGNVLVHCDKGKSRAPTMVIAYLMRKYHKSLDETLAEIRAKRKARPSVNFMNQLDVWDKVRYRVWEDEAGTVPKGPYKRILGLQEVRGEAA